MATSSQLLKKLDDLGVADNTIVVSHHRQWRRGMPLARWRLDSVSRRERHAIGKAASACPVRHALARRDQTRRDHQRNGARCRISFPTFAAANGEPALVEKVKKGYKIGDKTFKVHLDGVNLTTLPFAARKRNRRARASSTGATTATWWPSACATGRFPSRSSTTRASMCGKEISPTCGRRTFTISAPILSNGALKVSNMAGGWQNGCS